MAVRRTFEEPGDPVALVARDPGEARRAALRVLDGADDPAVRSTALRVLGLAHHELGDAATAHRVLSRAAAVAGRGGLADLAERARATRMGLRARRGTDRGLGAGPGGPGADALTALNRGVAAAQRGGFDAAADAFDAAARRLRRDGDERLLAGLLSNRGLALGYAGRFPEAADDLARALELAERHRLHVLGGVVLQNQGCLAVLRGDIASAMRLFGRAEPLLPGHRGAALQLDRVDALLATGMYGDAEALIRALPWSGIARHRDAEFAAAHLLRAKLHLLRGERQRATGHARRVRAAFPVGSMWAELAGQVEWSARFTPGRREPGRRRARAGATGAGLRAAAAIPGPRPAGAEAGAAACPAPVRLPEWAGELPATADVARLLARSIPATPLGPPRLAAPPPAHAAALRAAARGDRSSADRELRRGLAEARHRPVGTSHVELLAHVRPRDAELPRLGAELALGNGQAAAALEWIEQERSLVPAPLRCHDGTWGRLLDGYRAAERRSRAGRDTDLAEARRLAARFRLEQWHTGCADHRRPRRTATGGPVLPELVRELGRRAFVCYADLPGGPVAISLVEGRASVHQLRGGPALGDGVAKLLHAARRHAIAPGGAEGHHMREQAAALGRLLVDPVSAAIGDRELVVAPWGAARAVPWGLLPGLRGRAVSIAASGRAWLRCRERGRRAPAPGHRAHRVLLAAGPGLEWADAEIGALRRRHPGAVVLSGAAARTAPVLRELERADLAHLTAHGSFPAGAPMRAGLVLGDGPLFAYDLERVRRLPVVAVLSSCGVGQSGSSATGAPLGLTATLLALGAGAVVASVLPVRDRETTPAMLRLHDALLAGRPIAQAVADHLGDGGFCCFGAG
ncbi:CHAT domain-containing protein [Marinitenerispora sediminis]|uniref:CHAT domain-containing protein n=1 Tax=Marinitenerispora sediminis TaxID=1931232 RepID=A0A368T6T7_9ACTN|nr:CHAT domain-containing protein [Marinitenerispora sediminis]RCV50648.1 CHAT domain-containing protein [Marinitenerispora sediminis]RCV56210.1 CHAT domain-containing protein [Marinitenerispora sediminis]RCV59441.1 CHAT domain-containing protein [Marinitenerispora sediminis]